MLIDLAGALPQGKYRARAIRGATRIARQFALPDAARADLCRQILKTAADPADRKVVVEFMPRYPSPEMPRVAREAEAKAAAAAIEQKLR